jgi:hypothetical protein
MSKGSDNSSAACRSSWRACDATSCKKHVGGCRRPSGVFYIFAFPWSDLESCESREDL